jgi:hypothetical protein
MVSSEASERAECERRAEEDFRFFCTPERPALRLADLVLRSARPGPLRVIDLCCGTGALASALSLMAPDRLSSIWLIDRSPERLLEAKSKLEGQPGQLHATIGAFGLDSGLSVADFCPDVVVLNPPFVGYRVQERWMMDWKRRLGLVGYMDVACAFVLACVEQCPEGTIIGAVIRKDILHSAGYRPFFDRVRAKAEILSTEECAEAFLPRSKKALCALIVLRVARECGRLDSPLARRRGEAFSEVGEIAHVVAGPNTGSDANFLDAEESNAVIARIDGRGPTAYWSRRSQRRILWKPEIFSHRRNLKYQGRSGFVYKLAGSSFRTRLLLANEKFLSATPAVIPVNIEMLPLLVGTAALPAWRDYVRQTIRSLNFTPSAVAACLMPEPGSALGNLVNRLGCEILQVSQIAQYHECECEVFPEQLDSFAAANTAIRADLQALV